jgi:hypothetical protein
MNKLDLVCENAGDSFLHNTGYRRPQVHASESVNANILIGAKKSDAGMHHKIELCKLQPPSQNHLKDWIDSLVQQTGFENLDALLPLLELPSSYCLVFEKDHIGAEPSSDLLDILRTAVILSKCSTSSYDPNSPMIFTAKRLSRNLQLITINLDVFYGME